MKYFEILVKVRSNMDPIEVAYLIEESSVDYMDNAVWATVIEKENRKENNNERRK
jgi:hypothetical protein